LKQAKWAHSFSDCLRRVSPAWHPGMHLTVLEQEMIAAAAAGGLAGRGKGPVEPTEMEVWGKERTIRAEVLRHLLVENRWPVAAKGVRLRGVRISGHLDLKAAKLRCPLCLDSCYLDGPQPALGFASVSLLEMKGCHLEGLAAESLVVSADLDLSGSTFTCPIQLDGAAITGQLNCCGARLKGKDDSGDALIAEGLKVGGDLVLNKGFTTAGAIQLIGADITGQLNCSGARLNGAERDGNALIADTIRIGGGAFLSEGFTADGAIRLHGANITGVLDCSSAKLNGKNKHGYALHAPGMKVGGFVFLDNLCTDSEAGAIYLAGANIALELSCKGAKLNGVDNVGNTLIAFRMKVGTDVRLDGVSTKDGAIRLTGANITGQLNCHGAQLNGKDKEDNALYADSMTVGGRVIIDGGFTAAGTIRLPGANITGRLRCDGAELNGKDKHDRALLADEMTVGGGVALVGVCTTRGAIHMVGADIKEDLRCEGLRLKGTDKDGNALVANSVKAGNDVIIDGGFTAAGTIRLPGANITGRLRCGHVTLEGKDKDGRALLADGMKVGSGAWFGGVRTTCGAIRMVGADINGDLRCEGLRLKGTDEDGNALVADRIKVSGSVFLGPSKLSCSKRGSIAEGAVSLRSARVGGSLELKPEKLAGNDAEGKQKVALDLAGASITDDFVWEPGQAVRGEVILNDAKIGQLKDNLKLDPNGHWPSACDGLLRLDGFTYNRISEEPKTALEKRLAWIGSPDKPIRTNKRRIFTTQPYEQLESVYDKAGQDTEARKVAIARRRDLRRYGDLTPYRKVGNWLLDNSIRYGYRTWRAVVALAVLYAAAFVIFSIAQHHTQLMIPTMQQGLNPVPTAMHCTSNYPCFYPAAYAIDTVVPIIDVRQATYWSPNGHAPWGHVLAIFTWVSIVLGWILATLAVAGYTGLLRRD
jgi:hypothetical protein